jgi:hypothetical protein
MDIFGLFKRSVKGSRSKTRPGRLNYTTKKGNKYYQRNGHRVKKTHRPYGYHKKSRSKTHPGRLDFTTKKGMLDFQRNGHRIRRIRTPYNFI